MRSVFLLFLLFLGACASRPHHGTSQRGTASQSPPQIVAPPLGKNECATPGDVRHWEVAYCLWKTGKEDEFTTAVQECMGGEIKNDPSIPKADCERKLVLKTSIVRRLCLMTATVEAGNREPQDECFRKRFEKFVPTTVKAGH